MLNTKMWRPEMESFHPHQRFSLGKVGNWYIWSLEEIYPNKERKDIKCISETKCTFCYLLLLPLKLKAGLKDVQFVFFVFIALFFYLPCITYSFCAVLCDHLAYIDIFIWINLLLFISETVNSIGYSFLQILLLITCDRHSVFKPGELLYYILMLYSWYSKERSKDKLVLSCKTIIDNHPQCGLKYLVTKLNLFSFYDRQFCPVIRCQ